MHARVAPAVSNPEGSGMTDGLINSFAGRVGICVVLAALGLLASAVLTGVVLVRKAPPLTTQRDAMTGTTEHGIGRWFLGFMAFFVGLPTLALVIVTGVEVTHRISSVDAWPVLVAGLGLVAALAFGIRMMQKREPATVAAIPAPPEVAPVPQPGYFLPDNSDQWPR
jgi:hypothetical protein